MQMGILERESRQYALGIVGAGPAGLAAAIRLRQLSAESGKEITVCVLEKGSEVGAHIISGAVLAPRALNELIPDWQEKGAPLHAPVSYEKIRLLSDKRSISMQVCMLPAHMHSHGHTAVSFGIVSRLRTDEAEALHTQH